MQFNTTYSFIISHCSFAVLSAVDWLQAISLAVGWGGFSGIKNSPFEKIELPEEMLAHNTKS